MERTEKGRGEKGKEASWSLVLLQASVSTETPDWINREESVSDRLDSSADIVRLMLLKTHIETQPLTYQRISKINSELYHCNQCTLYTVFIENRHRFFKANTTTI